MSDDLTLKDMCLLFPKKYWRNVKPITGEISDIANEIIANDPTLADEPLTDDLFKTIHDAAMKKLKDK